MKPRLTVAEVLLVNRVIDAVGGSREVRLILRHDSPWLIVHFKPSWGDEATYLNVELEFGIWRSTLNVYRVIRGEADEDEIIHNKHRLTVEEIRKMMEEDVRARH